MSTTVNVPDKPGVGGVLSVYLKDGALGATWFEISQALNNGWVACVFDLAVGDYKMSLVDEASIDESGEDPVYEITVGNTTYETSDPQKKPSTGGGGGGDNLVGTAVVGTATAG